MDDQELLNTPYKELTRGQKTKYTNLKKDPDFYTKLGRAGGSVKVKKGFAMNPELAREAGKKGKRTKST